GQLLLVDCRTVSDLCEAILAMRIRGAPALGAAGAYGVALAAEAAPAAPNDRQAFLRWAGEELRRTRPTAVNLDWGIQRALAVVEELASATAEEVRVALWDFADRLADEDVAVNQELGRIGADLIPDGARILTH